MRRVAETTGLFPLLGSLPFRISALSVWYYNGCSYWWSTAIHPLNRSSYRWTAPSNLCLQRALSCMWSSVLPNRRHNPWTHSSLVSHHRTDRSLGRTKVLSSSDWGLSSLNLHPIPSSRQWSLETCGTGDFGWPTPSLPLDTPWSVPTHQIEFNLTSSDEGSVVSGRNTSSLILCLF